LIRTQLWRYGKQYGTAAIAALALVAALAAAGLPSQATVRKARARAARGQQSSAAPVKSYGSKSAPITMEVFTDYECPSCRAFFEQTLRPMINDYVASGKVYLIHRDFPLQMHTYSGQAARWANAAAKIGDFEPAESALYDNQTAWTADGNLQKYLSAAVSATDFRRMETIVKGCEGAAPQAKPNRGNPLPAGDHCSLDSAIASDIQQGYGVPVNATPTFVITYKGQRMPPDSGYVSWPLLKQFFDSLLAQ